VIRCAGDCIGVAAVLPLSVFRDKLPLQQALQFWKKRLQGSEEVQDKLVAALESSKTAILLSERVLNAPPELAPPLVAGLVSEIKALAAEKTAPERVHARFDLLLHCATAYVDSGAGAHDLGAVPLSTVTSIAVRLFTLVRYQTYLPFVLTNRMYWFTQCDC
jgi:BCCIP